MIFTVLLEEETSSLNDRPGSEGLQENSGRVHLALSCIGWPLLSMDEQRAWGTPIEAGGGEKIGKNLSTKELPEVCCPPEVDGTGESPVWDRKPNHCCKLTRIQLMNPESHSEMQSNLLF